jgi:hypothetical protein
MGYIIGLALAVFVLWWGFSRLRKYRQRHQLKQERLPPALKQLAWRNVPLLSQLSAAQQEKLEGLINVFLAEKRFTGFDGLEITDEIRVTVAAQACLLILNRERGFYSELVNIYMYPSAFVSKYETVIDGVIHSDYKARLGESWLRGPVVLSWQDAHHGGLNPDDGHNVVYHEFAHQLDQQTGATDGFPKMDASLEPEWARVMEHHYRTLQADAAAGRASLLDHYGATNPAEFFAVATETFYEKPEQLKREHPDLYKQLAVFYGMDLAELL